MTRLTKKDPITAAAGELNLPVWWVEAIVIEYMPCRKFTLPPDIWNFDFGSLDVNEVKAAVKDHKVAVIWPPLIHGVDRDVLIPRMMSRLVSDHWEPLGDMTVEGPAADSALPLPGNPPDAWDPKLNFGTHFQVLDDNRIWQWEIAEGDTSSGYWRWVSRDPRLDLAPIDIHVSLGDLRNQEVDATELSRKTFLKEVVSFYADLEAKRQRIREVLLAIHAERKAAWPYAAPDGPVPLLSHFESARIRNGALETSFSAAPVFFRACSEHAAEATKLEAESAKVSAVVAKKDRVYQERATAVIFATACLEAYVNRVGTYAHEELWPIVERKLSVEEKIKLLFDRVGKIAKADFGKQPFQPLVRLFKIRNEELMHPKAKFSPIVMVGTKPLTHIDNLMSADFVETLPKVVAAAVCRIALGLGEDPPWWAVPYIP